MRLHAGTPGYVFEAGNHYPDPEQTMQPDYLRRHGIGGVVVTGPARESAARSPLLRRLQSGVYDAYVVEEPTTLVPVLGREPVPVEFRDQLVTAEAGAPADSFTIRVNWFPRWSATLDGNQAMLERRNDGYIDVRSETPGRSLRLVYEVQPLDWAARVLATAGVVLALALASGVLPVLKGTPRLVSSSEEGDAIADALPHRNSR
jgi:hypothetical protein